MREASTSVLSHIELVGEHEVSQYKGTGLLDQLATKSCDDVATSRTALQLVQARSPQ